MQAPKRIVSIDIFRGLTILVMIFVNDVASVINIPGWLKHYPPAESGMTFVDLVFPAFLFIVGMSIPYAISNRQKKGDSFITLWKHIGIRTAGLLTIGILMVNIGALNPLETGLSKSIWMLLMFIGVILIWNSYPKGFTYSNYLRTLGFIIIAILVFLYRGGKEGDIHWLKTSWWGILGLIGWAYVVSCIVYFLFSKHLAGIIGMIFFFIALYVGDKSGALFFMETVSSVLWLGGHIGGHAAITTSGMAVSLIFMDNNYLKTIREKYIWTGVFALFLFIIGYLFQPLYGINKNLATPAWDLYSVSICSIIFLILYYLIDIKGYRKGLSIFKPTGSNPLLAYILPDIFYAILGIFQINFIHKHFSDGAIGVIRSIILTSLMVWLTSFLTKRKVKLHL